MKGKKLLELVPWQLCDKWL